ncbi:hypothetical protein A3D84_01375 [Candidatus Woesebacteria bacterium RIFCSPHIGHO2_02_FULL_42_20]|uniref:ABC transporter ATP-binding protein n=1 Tax=Candidatus Woesebacteria bacterium RIFCSPHIGHO2_12_FULL_41_24 TaxID=1802510 RepID=A0A1F8ART3_9BACT|nr:MAG: hypothetical protein A2W15_05590 [Candidatus Woesebacteria bacterium RBG_16_41_13]OGM30919.1 MAG: hypothetical protein A2873_03905 [Candidatus Woesebacteria bacterium RIFCSPHIGHO2_01_FULL_42_80]OGM35888.1 MAG: hypothetical protein A3D84_01375 [Candidatus Woesebacteria bacterium RIFCSPHIGHO2_02_FULL_42_20]OGM54219.1 MAG: hypothetical protein A3E44_00880 [Candidatus Woesebacteria bacterium RIFCSPHIGHO2_12_FULL_41_24]OGM66138.1 MAG: hypothetical protein A2969_04230 [Candidatus Woesebacteri
MFIQKTRVGFLLSKNMYKMLKTFYHFYASRRLVFIFFIFLVISSAILGSLTPYFYKLFVDSISLQQFNKLLLLLVIYIFVRVIDLIIHTLSFYVGDIHLALPSSANARTAIFKHIQDLDFAFHVRKSTGSLISVFKRGDGAFWNLSHQLHYKILNILVSFVVMLYFFSRLNLLITVTSVISFLVTIIAAKIWITYHIKLRNAANTEEDKVSAIIVDNMIGYETVKLFSNEAWEYHRLKNEFRIWLSKNFNYLFSYRVFDITIGSFVNISILAGIALALILVSGSKLGVGDFVLVVAFIESFHAKVWDLIWGFREIAKSYTDIQKYFGILDNEVQIKDPVNEKKLTIIKGEIEFSGVYFAYEKNTREALKNVNLKIREGQTVALVGRSGSGKTTLVKLLMRFYDVSRGKITIDDINIKNLSKSRLRSFIGVVPQEPILFNHSIKYNISYGRPRASLKEIVSAARMANIAEFIETLPKKYETQVGERGVKLSGGQKQRLAIARMILADPEIIIFDEATSQLDSESERLIQDAIWRVTANKTTIIIAHRLSTVMKADKIIVMDNGKIVEIGSHRELLARKKSLYRRFWNLQIKL